MAALNSGSLVEALATDLERDARTGQLGFERLELGVQPHQTAISRPGMPAARRSLIRPLT